MWEHTVDVQMGKRMLESGIFSKFGGCYGCPFSMQSKTMSSAGLFCIAPFSRDLVWVTEKQSVRCLDLICLFISCVYATNSKVSGYDDVMQQFKTDFFASAEGKRLVIREAIVTMERGAHAALWFSAWVMVTWLIVAVLCFLVEKVLGFLFGTISSS